MKPDGPPLLIDLTQDNCEPLSAKMWFVPLSLVALTAFPSRFGLAAPTGSTQATEIYHLPAERRQAAVAPGEQICEVSEIGNYPRKGMYILYVGEPFDKGDGCNSVFNAVSDAVGGIEYPRGQWVCAGSGAHNESTTLMFIALPSTEDKFNKALDQRYQAVTSGFHCCLYCRTQKRHVEALSSSTAAQSCQGQPGGDGYAEYTADVGETVQGTMQSAQ